MTILFLQWKTVYMERLSLDWNKALSFQSCKALQLQSTPHHLMVNKLGQTNVTERDTMQNSYWPE